MEYRQIDRTALQAGVIGLGCEHLAGTDAVLQTADGRPVHPLCADPSGGGFGAGGLLFGGADPGSGGYLELSDAERDDAPVVGSRRNDVKGNCVYCNHCRPCPAGINIAALNKYLDIAKLEKSAIPPGIAQHYRALEHTASKCIGCGSCEKRCSFDVPVIENMKLATRLFGC